MKKNYIIAIIIVIAMSVALYFFLGWYSMRSFDNCMQEVDDMFYESVVKECGVKADGKLKTCENYPEDKRNYFKEKNKECLNRSQKINYF